MVDLYHFGPPVYNQIKDLFNVLYDLFNEFMIYSTSL